MGKRFTKENAKYFGSRGGKKSAQIRENKETAKEILTRLLEATDEDGESVKESIVLELINMALQGDLQAIKYVMELSGEVPTQRVEVTGKDGAPLVEHKRLSYAEIKQLMKELEEEI